MSIVTSNIRKDKEVGAKKSNEKLQTLRAIGLHVAIWFSVVGYLILGASFIFALEYDTNTAVDNSSDKARFQ